MHDSTPDFAMDQDSELDSLASTISGASKILSGYCTLERNPQPSLNGQGATTALPHTAPHYVRQAREQLLSAAHRIQKLVTEPTEYLPELAVQYQYIACLKWLCHFHIFAAVPSDGTVTYAHLASVCSVPERQLRSVIRMAITSGCLCEPKEGHVAHNAVSRNFFTNPAYLGWVRFMTDFYMPVSLGMTEATEKWGDSEKRTETAANAAMDTQLTTFDFITKSREFNKLFSSYMKAVSGSEGTTVRHLPNDYHWEKLSNGLIVHIAGSPGSVSVALAEAFPQLRFVIQDSAEQVENSRGFLRSQPDSIRSRIELSTYNLFSPQPVTHADVYVMRMCLHNQTDTDARRILLPLLPILKGNSAARLLIIDTLLPAPESAGAHAEALERYRDLVMKQCFNTKERDAAEFHSVLSSVSDGSGCLAIRDIRKSPGCALSSIEVAYELNDQIIRT